MFVDTHTHLYLEDFTADLNQAVDRAMAAGVGLMFLPNIDLTSWQPMLDACAKYKDICFPMAGLHPTSVLPETIEAELDAVKTQLETGSYVAVGEIGIDLYWDRKHQGLQEDVFRTQLQWAKQYNLPVAIHVRNSYNEVWRILKHELTTGITGVFHCFPGNELQAAQVVEAGFKLGIGGVVTYKKSGMQDVVRVMGLDHIVLETDSPFLTPAPHRGTRNEPAYIPLIAQRVAEICEVSTSDVAETSTRNALQLFAKVNTTIRK